MVTFKVGDRVRIASFAPVHSGKIGTVTRVQDHDAGVLPLQECSIDFGAHSHAYLSMHLRHATRPIRLFCGEVARRWPLLGKVEVEQTGGDTMKISHLLQQAYGCSPARARREIEQVVADFCEKMHLAY